MTSTLRVAARRRHRAGPGFQPGLGSIFLRSRQGASPVLENPLNLRKPSLVTSVSLSEEVVMSAATRCTFLLLCSLALLVLPAGAGSAGGSGLISATRVGPLKIGVATRAQVRAWAGSPSKIWTGGNDQAPVLFSGLLWEYDCAGASPVDGLPCMTLYGFLKGRLRSFSTSDIRFHTGKGVRVGTALKTAVKRQKGKWSGWGWQCPGVTFPSGKKVVFVAHIAKKNNTGPAQVSGFYLSKMPDSFSSCGS
jgi:hypothetical protein